MLIRKHIISILFERLFFQLLLFSGILVSVADAQQPDTLNFNQQIIYHVTYQTDSNDEQSRNELDMELLLNDETSMFQSISKGRRDSIYHAEKRVRMPTLLMGPVNKFSYQIIKNGTLIKTYDSAFGMNLQGVDQIYYYEEPMNIFKWQIKADTTRIAGMLCQRADVRFGGRDWVAWFTAEIPISDGPYKFCGLPGLIVSLADVKNYWRFDLTHIRKVEKDVILNFQSWYEYVPATKEQLFRERRMFQNNLVAMQEAAGADLSVRTSKEHTHENVKKNVTKRMANDNNWIELYP